MSELTGLKYLLVNSDILSRLGCLRIPQDYLKWLSGTDDLDEDMQFTVGHYLKVGQVTIKNK